MHFLQKRYLINEFVGALPTLYAAIADVNGGEYFEPDGFMGMRGYPKKVSSNKRSHDQVVAAKLWDVSEQLTDVQYQFTINKPVAV